MNMETWNGMIHLYMKESQRLTESQGIPKETRWTPH